MADVGKRMQVGLCWAKTGAGKLPYDAIETQPGVYVCRAWHEGEQIPGTYVPRYALAYVSYAGKEHQKTECEVLCDTSTLGNIPRK
ncbi:unnamed protein product [Dibothriocephalus latus]|uniref:Uncharacterized protein n=1 Tax=Dibothriocephalus latus TaxID=60516 RepID=A0A3P7QEV6_DIBLA|nr:unnamed protein product [Dibothriocephalus latus]